MNRPDGSTIPPESDVAGVGCQPHQSTCSNDMEHLSMSKYSAISFDRKPRNDEGTALVAVAEPEDRLVAPPAGSEAVAELKIFDMEDQDDDPFGQSIAEKLTADNLEEGLNCIKPGW